MAKTVLITGASGGIGLRIAKSLISSGFNMVLQGNRNMEVLMALQELHPDRVRVVSADISSMDGIALVVQAAADCDAVLHCAGIPSAGISWKVSTEEFRKVNAVNYEAPFFLSQGIIPSMRKKNWGRIVFFSSIVAQTGIPGTTAYSASKSALFGMTRTMASELATNHITVNCIAPGYMDEGMIREIPEAMRAEIIAKTPVAKLSDTDGIVKMVELLLSNEANSITGQVLSVNGGLGM
ncbi:MAG: SDR family NAD(P)-dependent oxidoreductase [Flavobacteriales bacterium]|jgi:3-oxoacyl-[acyl-carrier protein] reductase